METQPSYIGYIEATNDAIRLFEACLQGVIPHVFGRRHNQELIKSGDVFIYEKNSSGIGLWNDGILWSSSTIHGNFLIYRELERLTPAWNTDLATNNYKSPVTGSLVDSYSLKEGGLVKKTISVTVDGISHHLVSYYKSDDFLNNRLSIPQTTQDYKNSLLVMNLFATKTSVPPLMRLILRTTYRVALQPWLAIAKRLGVGFVHSDRDDHEDEDQSPPNTPSPDQRRKTRNPAKAKSGGSGTSSRTRTSADSRDGNQKRHVATPRLSIEDRPYCTHHCLLGLVNGWSLDEKCPNIDDHPTKHIKKTKFLQLIRNQLATDRGDDADCVQLNLAGSRGTLFKVRLSSHGYTMVAKGVRWFHIKRLENKQDIYDRIRSLQGTMVPVCLGSVDLERPQYFNGGEYVRMLFLSWVGQPLFNHINNQNRSDYLRQTIVAFKALHRLQVLHRDAEFRNILVEEGKQSIMLVDFEEAKVELRQPLRTVTPNRKRKSSEIIQKNSSDDKFDAELRRVQAYFYRSVRS